LGCLTRQAEILDQRPEWFRDRPGLGRTTARLVRRIRVKNFRDLAEATFVQMRGQPIQE